VKTLRQSTPSVLRKTKECDWQQEDGKIEDEVRKVRRAMVPSNEKI
jgi:hypothetical protein